MKKYVLLVSGMLFFGAGLLHAAAEEECLDELSLEEMVYCKLDKVKKLVDASPDLLHEKCGGRGWTLLHYAKVINNFEMVKMLVQHGALVNAEANSPKRVKPIGACVSRYTPDPKEQGEIMLYLVLSGAQVSEELESWWQRHRKQSLRGLQQEYRKRQQKAIQEKTYFPKVLAALILDFEKGEKPYKARIAK